MDLQDTTWITWCNCLIFLLKNYWVHNLVLKLTSWINYFYIDITLSLPGRMLRYAQLFLWRHFAQHAVNRQLCPHHTRLFSDVHKNYSLTVVFLLLLYVPLLQCPLNSSKNISPSYSNIMCFCPQSLLPNNKTWKVMTS